LDYLASFDGVDIYFIPEIQGYEICPGKANESIRKKVAELLTNADKAIDHIIKDFGKFGAKDLELRSTIVFVNRDLKRSGESFSRKKIINLVQEIKPHFSREEIDNALAELETKNYINDGMEKI
jgi:hypothetical protein